MAVIRFGSILLAIVAFFLVGVPLQWLIARRAPTAAHRIPAFFCRSLLWLARVRVETLEHHVSERPALLAANHVSWIDILALGSIAPFCFLAKSDVASWPLVSAFAALQGTVFVDRKRRRTIPRANAALAARMLEGRPVLLFPEGTTVADAMPGPFLSSHFAAARDLLANSGRHGSVMVQPVAIAYSSPAAAWVGDDDLVSHLWRTLRAPPLRCTVAFGRAVPFRRGDDRKRFAAKSRDAVIESLRARPDWLGRAAVLDGCMPGAVASNNIATAAPADVGAS